MFFAVNRLLVSIQAMFFLPSVPNYGPVEGKELAGCGGSAAAGGGATDNTQGD